MDSRLLDFESVLACTPFFQHLTAWMVLCWRSRVFDQGEEVKVRKSPSQIKPPQKFKPTSDPKQLYLKERNRKMYKNGLWCRFIQNNTHTVTPATLLPVFGNAKWYQELMWFPTSQACFRESITVRTSAQVRFPFNETDEQLIKTQQRRNQGRREPAESRGPKGSGKLSMRL